MFSLGREMGEKCAGRGGITIMISAEVTYNHTTNYILKPYNTCKYV